MVEELAMILGAHAFTKIRICNGKSFLGARTLRCDEIDAYDDVVNVLVVLWRST